MERILNCINKFDLEVHIPNITIFDVNSISDVDNIVKQITYGGPRFFDSINKSFPIEDKRPQLSIWKLFQKELHLLLCTRDKKYAKIRSTFEKQNSLNTTIIISAISAEIGSVIGTDATIIAPMCALCLYTCIKLGKETLCSFLYNSYNDSGN